MDATQLARSGPSGRVIGRYALFGEIGRGGMATVHLGRMLGPVGFARTVAIKRMRPQASEFASMFVDEARICARIQHPNVVTTLDVVTIDDELLLVRGGWRRPSPRP
jgi:eukaryotic-like serine/threonine-protein kinase